MIERVLPGSTRMSMKLTYEYGRSEVATAKYPKKYDEMLAKVMHLHQVRNGRKITKTALMGGILELFAREVAFDLDEQLEKVIQSEEQTDSLSVA